MNTQEQARSWVYAEEFPLEAPAVASARAGAERLDAAPVAPSVASLLTVLAAATKAQHAVEIGCGAGVATAALLTGLAPGAALTAIDIDATRCQTTRTLLAAAGLDKSHRVRVITGDAAEVLPRLSEASYDLAFIDAGSQLAEQLVYDTLALLEPGGLLILHDPLVGGAVANPTARDAVTVSVRSVLHEVAACTADVFVSLVHAGEGLYLVYKR